jgi:membrane fusion protein, heavy metal efflux system
MTIARTCALFGWMLSIAACGAWPPDRTAHATTDAAPANPLEITADGSLLADLRVGEPTWRDVTVSQTVTGSIEVDQTRATHVGSPVLGRIAELSVVEGQKVRRGDRLATLHSTGLNDAQLTFLKALSVRLESQRAVDRAKRLREADVIGAAELQNREAVLAQANAEVDAARDQLALLGMTPSAIDRLEQTRHIDSVSRIVSPMDGTVLRRRATIGQVVHPAQTLFEIADLSNVWLQADVPEQHAANLRVGTTVEAHVAALRDVTITGALSFVSSTVTRETRTVRVRMDVPNPGGRLKPAMLATVTLRGLPERRRVVPAAAIVRDGTADRVFVQVDADTFVLRPVSLGAGVSEGYRVLVEGVREGEKILVAGAGRLDAARRRRMAAVDEAHVGG